jgi:Beta-lactamase enzyme family
MNTAVPNPHDALAQALLQAVRAQRFELTADKEQRGAPVGVHPSIDLAVVAFPKNKAPMWANVLFSREHPQGHAAAIGANASALQGLRFDADQRNAAGDSVAWAPRADWQRLKWRALTNPSATSGTAHAPRFVAPYPASLLKLMVAVGVALAVDKGLCAWPDALEPMITVSSNEATDECVALLHRVGLLSPRASNALNTAFAAWGLPTLQLHNTQAHGGWRNPDGAGVGQIHMTAWCTARLLWLLDAGAPPAPWLLPPAKPQADAQGISRGLLQPATRDRLRGVLQRQQLDEILSSGSLKKLPGWVAGLPDAPAFAHKTGTTENFASDAGILLTPNVHAVIAVLTNLGDRYAPHPDCATTWRLPALGAAIFAALQQLA